MLKQKTPLLLTGQDLHWSTQRIVSVIMQIAMLLLCIVFLTKVIIAIGERRLQEDWATQRYSELQTVGSLLADRITFQQFHTKMFARSELLKRYLTIPNEERQQQLLEHWTIVTENTPELLDIALFDAQARFKFATNELFNRQPLPDALLGEERSIGGDEIYTSPIEFIPIDGQLEPYMYQVAWLENPDQTIRGYIVTHQSISYILKSIKPDDSALKSPLLMFDNQGIIYSGVNKEHNINRIPNIMGGSLRQSYPALWRKMSNSNFGQFNGDDATFVYLKVELTTQYETHREYYLASYIRNSVITENFSDWKNLLLVGATVLALLGIILIYLSHAYRIGYRSREFSIELANRLFNNDIGCIIINENNRVETANNKAATLLNMPLEELSDRSLQRILQLEDDQYAAIIQQLEKVHKWQGVLNFEEQYGNSLSITINQSPQNNSYLIVTFEDISQLKQVQQQAHLNQLLNDNAVACALLKSNGELLLANDTFLTLFSLHDSQGNNLLNLLEIDVQKQWSRMTQQLQLRGHWKGQISSKNQDSINLQATLKGHLDQAGEVEYIVCTLESQPRGYIEQHRGEFMPQRSTILINQEDLKNYFDNLNEQSRDFSSLLMLEITAENMLSHMSDISLLESRQREVEVHILKSLPAGYQMSHWQVGKLIIIMPDTLSDEAHQFGIKMLSSLNDIGQGKGISMGITSYQPNQTLEQYLNNAEVALKRAKQIGEQSIGQAFTRQ